MSDPTDTTEFYSLPRPLQVLLNNDPEEYFQMGDIRELWAKLTLQQISAELCKVCEYLDVKHDCYALRSIGLDIMLESFIKSEDFDFDESRHAILLIIQSMQDGIYCGHLIHSLIRRENPLGDTDVEYTHYIVKTFFDATRNHLPKDMVYAMAETLVRLEREQPCVAAATYDTPSAQDDSAAKNQNSAVNQYPVTNQINNNNSFGSDAREPGNIENSLLEFYDRELGNIENILPKLDINVKDLTIIEEMGIPNEDVNEFLSPSNNDNNNKGRKVRTSPNSSEHIELHQLKGWYEYSTYFEHLHIFMFKRDARMSYDGSYRAAILA